MPVPPPAPAVMKTMSAPLSRLFSSSYCSIADWRPSVGVRPRAEAAGGVVADVHARGRARLLERLHVGVDGDELHALDLRLDHAVDGVHAGAADADHAQDGLAGERRLGACTGSCSAAGRVGAAADGSGARSRMFSGMSEEKTVRRRSSGVGTRLVARAAGRWALGAAARARARGSRRARGVGRALLAARRRRRAAPARRSSLGGPPRPSLRNSAASGPSRMLARLPLAMSRGPPLPAGGRRTPPCRQGRT